MTQKEARTPEEFDEALKTERENYMMLDNKSKLPITQDSIQTKDGITIVRKGIIGDPEPVKCISAELLAINGDNGEWIIEEAFFNNGTQTRVSIYNNMSIDPEPEFVIYLESGDRGSEAYQKAIKDFVLDTVNDICRRFVLEHLNNKNVIEILTEVEVLTKESE